MSLFKKLFGGTKLEPIDLSIIKTDLHSHLIPGIDDGSKSMEDSLAMLRKFKSLGYQKVITTPHIMIDYYKNNPEIILGGLEKVREALKTENIDIEIEAAAEYYLDPHFEELIAKKELLTFGDNHILFELSFMEEPPRVKDTIFSLITEGYKPILAHVERYPFYHSKWDIIEELKSRDCLLQLNINSLSGQYGPQVKKMAEQLIEKELIDVIGSDCHHMGHLEMMDGLRTNKHLHTIASKTNLLNKTL
ncbi:histidinol phosphatase [Paracrocinitomix mangrovi]|uniref:tyrosine-protein phosphatase n=1 Tax=Paracrocinitomix mangrovi TaxID=2862509 RepID=UPI001C8E5A1B|nr:CpsB/CapC family capsule biosynthesis tyrosine phosphatase [Paracrocinitomix mangrovi]UKN03339.1 histidinol phosphatase [Paracrocinitomix mangrovi]